MGLPSNGLWTVLRLCFLTMLPLSNNGWVGPLKVRRPLHDSFREPLRGCLSSCPGLDRIHSKHAMGYSAMLDHSTETLTLLDQSSQDVHPVEDFNGVTYPSFAQVHLLEVLHLASTNKIIQLNARVIQATQT